MSSADRFADRINDPRSALMLWGNVALIVGFAQMFRTPIEQVLGMMYLTAGVAMLLARLTMRVNMAVLGFSLAAIGFGARSFSAPFIPNATWHGAMIVFTAWGAFALVNAAWAIRSARNTG